MLARQISALGVIQEGASASLESSESRKRLTRMDALRDFVHNRGQESRRLIEWLLDLGSKKKEKKEREVHFRFLFFILSFNDPFGVCVCVCLRKELDHKPAKHNQDGTGKLPPSTRRPTRPLPFGVQDRGRAQIGGESRAKFAVNQEGKRVGRLGQENGLKIITIVVGPSGSESMSKQTPRSPAKVSQHDSRQHKHKAGHRVPGFFRQGSSLSLLFIN